MKPKPNKDLFQGVEDGFTLATGHSLGLLEPAVRQLFEDYHRFNNDDARAAFAGTWLSLISRKLNVTWPAIYQLLDLVRERELYKKPTLIHSKQTYETFDAFFEDLFGQPFSTWAELEKTYSFVRKLRPDLFSESYEKAETERKTYEANPEASKNHGGDRKSESRPNLGLDRRSDRAKRNGVSDETQRYLDALAKVRPDLLDRVNRGELKTYKAARLAGIVKVPTPLELLKRAWEKASTDERKAFLDWIDPEL